VKWISFLLMFSCSHFSKTYYPSESLKESNVLHLSLDSNKEKLPIIDSASVKSKAVWQGQSWKVVGAESILKNASVVTAGIWFNINSKDTEYQDLLAISVGGNEKTTTASRLGLRIENESIVGIVRANDKDRGIHIYSEPTKIKLGEWNHAVITVNYAENSVKIFLNGELLELKNQPKFTQPYASNTDSLLIALGSEDDGNSGYVKGNLKEVMVWRRILQNKEIKELYLSSKRVVK
jgi:hypothetical protein